MTNLTIVAAALVGTSAAAADAPKFDPKPLATLELPAGEAGADITFNHVAFSPDGKYLAASSFHDPRIRIWEVATRKLVLSPAVPDEKGAGPLAWSADSKRLAATNSIGQRIHVYEIPSGQTHWETKAVGIKTYALAFSADGKTVACVGDRNYIYLRDGATGRETKNDSFLGAPGKFIAFTAAGRIVTIGPDDTIPRVLHADTLKRAKPWDDPALQRKKDFAHERTVYLGALSPDGKLAASCNNEELRIWNLDAGTAVAAGRPDVGLHGIAFTGDGRMLVVRSNNEAKLAAVDAATGRPCGRLDRGAEVWNSFAFSTDGLMAVGAKGQKVLLFTLTGK